MSAKMNYFKGNYLAAAESKTNPKDLVYKIAGLIFTGQHLPARILAKEHLSKLNLQDRIFLQFHLGLSYVRTSEYGLAKEQFLKNVLLFRTNKTNDVSSFLCFHGLSFYRFFFSKHKKSYLWAKRAYGYLLNSKNSQPLFLGLSLDLQGHNLIQLGQIHHGIAQLKKAFEVCDENDFLNLKNDIEVSISVYTSDYSDNPKLQIERLKNLLSGNKKQSDFIKSALVLQIAKLFILNGKYSAARDFLTFNYDLIYNNDNKRNIAVLNTIMAELLYKNGQFLEALSVTKIARRNLDEQIDISLLLPILNLEIKLLGLLNKDASQLFQYTKNLVFKIDRYLDQKIFSRIKNESMLNEIGQDPLGDIIDLCDQKSESALELILRNDLLGLLPKFFELEPGQKYLLIVSELNYLFTIDSNSIEFVSALSKNQFYFLQKLTLKGVTKEQLIESIWGYEYDPLRHDSLIYTTISRIKKKLKERKQWIIADENKYFIQSDVKIAFKNYKTRLKAAKKVNPILSSSASSSAIPNLSSSSNAFTSTDISKNIKANSKTITRTNQNQNFEGTTLHQPIYSENFNYRILQILEDPPLTPISVSEYANMWNVTRMTSLRDLTLICQTGHGTKIGRGKATRYLLN